jgi:hypothetical protein
VADDVLDAVRFDDRGLVPAIVQEDASGDVLMMAWMNAESLRLTFAEGRTVFWSRSRQELWRKGDTSGEVQLVRSTNSVAERVTPAPGAASSGRSPTRPIPRRRDPTRRSRPRRLPFAGA